MKDQPSINCTEYFMNKCVESISTESSNELMRFLKNSLEELGFNFPSDEHLLIFCKERITRVLRTESNCVDFYLDFIDFRLHKGILVCSYTDSVETKMEGNTITAVLKRTFKK